MTHHELSQSVRPCPNMPWPATSPDLFNLSWPVPTLMTCSDLFRPLLTSHDLSWPVSSWPYSSCPAKTRSANPDPFWPVQTFSNQSCPDLVLTKQFVNFKSILLYKKIWQHLNTFQKPSKQFPANLSDIFVSSDASKLSQSIKTVGVGLHQTKLDFVFPNQN